MPTPSTAPIELPPLPTFLIIGAQKAATRWLRSNLGAHGSIFTAPQEVKFFNHPRRIETLGTDWYRRQFAGWAGEPVVGEATPGYLMWRHEPAQVAARIDATLPGVRLLAMLRDPVDRAASALAHHRTGERIHPRTTLLEHVRRTDPEDDWLGVVTGGWYAASLAPYVDRFGDRLCVLLYDDLVRDPAEVYSRAVAHLGAEAGYEPPSLGRVVQGGGGRCSPLSAEDRRSVFRYFADDVDRLEVVLGRDLSAWRP